MATPTPSPRKHRKKRRKRKMHDRSRSEGFKHFKYSPHVHGSQVPRKLGPIEIGRINYKGTKYEEKKTGSFLDEKIPFHSRTCSFELRKRKNPVEKRPGLKDIGTPHSWKKPKWYQSESDLINLQSGLDFLHDNKPMHVHDKSLDKFRDVHIPKGKFAQEEVAPFSWKPPSFDINIDNAHFLNEKFWYEASKVGIDGEFAHLLQTLTPEKLTKIKDIPPPTGYDTKINYLNRLKKIVFEDHMQTQKEAFFNLSLTALKDQNEPQMEGQRLLGEPLNQLSESEFDKQMDDALNEILAASPQPPPPDALLDDQINDALEEIFAAPSPSPQPPSPPPEEDRKEEDHSEVCEDRPKRDRSRDRRSLIKTIKKNLSDIQNQTNKAENKELNTLTLDIASNCKDWKVEDSAAEPIEIDHIQKKYKQIKYSKHDRNNGYKLDILSEKKQVKATTNTNGNNMFRHKIPSNFICPISKNIMNEAVMAADGRIYDRINMETWMETHDVSPVSGKRLRHTELMPFNPLTNEISAWKMKNRVKKKKKRRRRSPLLKTKAKQWNHALPSS
eukprot:224187_1